MFYIVYETTNLINNKKYRGIHQTRVIDDNYLGSGKILLSAVKKYGRSNFKREVLELCTSREEMLNREKVWVDSEWLSRDDTYNLKLGGFGFQSDDVSGNKNSFYGKKHTEANKKAQSERMSLRVGDINHFYGKRHTNDSIEKIKLKCKASALYGDDNPAKQQVNREKISRGLRGKPKTAAHRCSLSVSKTRIYIVESPDGKFFEISKGDIKDFCNQNGLHYYSFLKYLNRGPIPETITNVRDSKHFSLLPNTIGWVISHKKKAA